MHRIYQNFWTYLCWYLTENDALQVELNVAKEREKMARDVKNKDDDGTENHIMYRRDKRTSSQMKWKMHDCMRIINAHIHTTSETDSHTQPRTPTSPNGISNELTRAGIYLFINIWLSQPHYHIQNGPKSVFPVHGNLTRVYLEYFGIRATTATATAVNFVHNMCMDRRDGLADRKARAQFPSRLTLSLHAATFSEHSTHRRYPWLCIKHNKITTIALFNRNCIVLNMLSTLSVHIPLFLLLLLLLLFAGCRSVNTRSQNNSTFFCHRPIQCEFYYFAKIFAIKIKKLTIKLSPRICNLKRQRTEKDVESKQRQYSRPVLEIIEQKHVR